MDDPIRRDVRMLKGYAVFVTALFAIVSSAGATRAIAGASSHGVFAPTPE